MCLVDEQGRGVLLWDISRTHKKDNVGMAGSVGLGMYNLESITRFFKQKRWLRNCFI
jgi:hypothetical protein